MNVLIAAIAAQGDANMNDLNTETTEADTTTAAKAPETAKKKASRGARVPRVAKSKGKATKKASPAKKAPKTAPKAKGAKAPKARAAREGSKTESILGLLRRSGGVTLKELMKQTGWQAHSVRGFLSAVVGKKMKLTVDSTKAENGERIYSVKA
jgi:hypothetical protein